MQWAWFLACLVYVSPGLASHKHFHELSKRIFHMELTNPDANFGYSISSVHSGARSKLVVGAPLADLTGKIYTCDLNKNEINDCKSTNRDAITRYKDKPQYNKTYWYGATVEGTDTYFVGCAPLALDKDTKIFKDEPVGTYGRCYKDRDDGKGPILLKSITASTRKQGNTMKDKYDTFEETMDSFGWSLSIDSSDSILIGSPAVVRGRIMEVKGNSVLYMNGAWSNKTSYNFGYAVASGIFYSTIKNFKIIAVGSTYGSGEVAFFTERDLKILKAKAVHGSSVGSMFGAVLCAAYLHAPSTPSKPRVADLLIGAPTFAENEDYNIGAVYIYHGTTDKKAPEMVKRIVGAKPGSHFGSAIISLGDLNGDNRDEIAIGAPYENEGRGTVYLYSGANLVDNDVVKPMQTIAPEDALSFKTFGYSLTVVKDYDDNGCNELAIGAPESNKVMVLRCMAAITIKLNKFPQQLPGTSGIDKIETLQVCITATFQDKPTEVNADVQVTVNIDHNDAKLSESCKNGILIFHIHRQNASKTENFCKDIELEISGSKGNYNKEILYKLNAILLSSPINKKDFKGSDVILSEHSVLAVDGAMRVQECGSRKCVPILKMTTSFSEGSPYLIGSSPLINMTVEVENTGEVAYEACVRVTVAGATVPHPPDVCVADENQADKIVCTPRQLLRKSPGKHWILNDFSIDTTQLTNKDTKVSVTVELYEDCLKNDNKTEKKEFELYADATSVDVNGRTDEGISDIVNLTKSDIRVQKNFEHIYTISNSGPTTWVDVPVTVEMEKLDFVTRLVYVQQSKCEPDHTTDSDKTLKFSCLAPKLAPHANVEAKVVMQVVTDELNKIIHNTVTVHSNITVQLNDTLKKHASVTSVLRLVEVSVPIWIIIAASILALVILVIIFFILRECGLLKTENKVQLKRARMSVRRQTIMRQSTLNRPRTQDQEELIDASEAAASEANKKPKKDRRVVINDF